MAEKRKALAIDDEQVVLDSIKKVLTAENYDVDVTLNGGGGIYKAIKKSYDIVLTDIRMPDINGLHVLRDVKRAKPALPVVIITGYATVQNAVQAMKLGATDYIEKPFTPDHLLATVAKAIDAAAKQECETQTIIHKTEVLKVLERASVDEDFARKLLHRGSDALESYDLTSPEKLAIVTGDIQWIEEQIGRLKKSQKQWLEQRLAAEIW
jgi:DNA-binding NtrC family response regulator